jgi:hypothetical protein
VQERKLWEWVGAGSSFLTRVGICFEAISRYPRIQEWRNQTFVLVHMPLVLSVFTIVTALGRCCNLTPTRFGKFLLAKIDLKFGNSVISMPSLRRAMECMFFK